MRKNNTFMGIILILAAVLMMASAMGIMPNIPWFKMLCAGIVGGWTIRALGNRDFFGATTSAGIITWIFDKELGIEHLTPFPLLVAAVLVGIGLNMIIGKKKRVVQIHYRDGETWNSGSMDDVCEEEWQDGRHVTLENSFNSTSKYVNSTSFATAKLENNFGAANVYFNNATIYNGEAVVELENNFGQMNIYFPKNWRANISQETSFGHVNVFGEPNRDMDAPYVIVKAASNFGQLNIYFE